MKPGTFRAGAALALVLALLVVRDASAGPPTDQLRTSIDLVLKILADPELKRETKTVERRAAIRAVADGIFDFNEISRRSLALHWQARTPAERAEFVRLFADLLENSYVSKIEGYAGEKIQFAGDTVDGTQAIVRTRIVTKQGTEVPIDYRMMRQGEQWRVYDVSIEGISLVGNYRAQFNTIIQRSGYADLVAKLKAKQAERPGLRETARRDEAGGAAAPAPPPRRGQSL